MERKIVHAESLTLNMELTMAKKKVAVKKPMPKSKGKKC